MRGISAVLGITRMLTWGKSLAPRFRLADGLTFAVVLTTLLVLNRRCLFARQKLRQIA